MYVYINLETYEKKVGKLHKISNYYLWLITFTLLLISMLYKLIWQKMRTNDSYFYYYVIVFTLLENL